MRNWRGVVAAVALIAGACDRAASTLTQPSGPPTPGLPSPELTVRVDSRGSAVAIVGISEVTFDARGTPGDKLRYELQFGDGASATTALATHVYAATGTFTTTLTVIDAADRRSSTSAMVIVKTVTGTWFYSDYNERSRRAEVHRVAIEAQDGDTVRGLYSTPDRPDTTIAGTLRADRSIRLVAADQSITLEGLVSDDVESDWSLTARGSRIDSQTVPFRYAAGPASGPAPTARLSVRFDPAQTFFTRPVLGVTEIAFDASGSNGDQLSFVIEYGDGEFTRDPVARHAAVESGALIARATVTDRAGRFAVATQSFGPVGCLCARITDYCCGYEHWTNSIQNRVAGRIESRNLQIAPPNGLTFTGRYWHPEGWWSSFSGKLDGHGGIEFRLDDGTISFTGSVYFVQVYAIARVPFFRLTVSGGSADGMTLEFHWVPEFA